MLIKIFLLISLVKSVFCTNILFITLLPSPSHHIWHEALVEGLLGNGYNVTMFSYFKPTIKHKNYTLHYIDATSSLEAMDEFLETIPQTPTLLAIASVWMATPDVCKFSFESEEFQKILNYPTNFFDLLVFDLAFAHCYLPLIDYFDKPPTIGITAFGMQPYINEMIGQRTECYSPFYNLPYTNKMSFFERFNNLIHQTFEKLCKWHYTKEITEESRNFFGKNIPNLDEYEKSLSLIFTNDDPIMDYPKAFPPNVISIGGIHLKKPKKLEGDLQKIMDDSKNGVILVSMGSNFKAKHYRDDVKKALVEAFSRLKVTVLWKFEDELKVSENVHMKKWLPQRDILAHPNTKLFITHCGALSTQEIIVRGVPIVGIPLYMDQHYKAAKFQSTESGVVLKYSELTADIIYDGINEVLSNPKYKENIMKLSSLYKNQPQQPLEKFLVWTEYVLKNGHLDHLSVASRYMKWYQVDNWDICGFCIAMILFTIYICKRICCFVLKFLKKNDFKKEKQY